VRKARQEEQAAIQKAKDRENSVIESQRQNLKATIDGTEAELKKTQEIQEKKKAEVKQKIKTELQTLEEKTNAAVAQVGQKAEEMAQAQAKAKIASARSVESKKAAQEIEKKKEVIEKGTEQDTRQEQSIQDQIDTVKKQYLDAVQAFKQYNEQMAAKFQEAFVPEENFPTTETEVASSEVVVSHSNSNMIVASLLLTNIMSAGLFYNVYTNSKKYMTFKTVLLDEGF